MAMAGRSGIAAAAAATSDELGLHHLLLAMHNIDRSDFDSDAELDPSAMVRESSPVERLCEEQQKEKLLLSSVFGDSDTESDPLATVSESSPVEHLQEEQHEDNLLLSSVFGGSDPESDPLATVNEVQLEHSWERIEKVPGLWLCKHLLNDLQQQQLLAAINSEGWFTDKLQNQAMKFGDLPSWALQLSNLIYDATCAYTLANECLFPHSDVRSHLPLDLKILWRLPLFDQLIANCYHPGEGICAHVDLLKFEDGIAIISLESTCVMHFKRVQPSCQQNISLYESKHLYDRQARHTFAEAKAVVSEQESLITKVPILLQPGDVVLISGEARYDWTHEINRSEGCQVWNGQMIPQKRRISVTLRKIIASEQEVQNQSP